MDTETEQSAGRRFLNHLLAIEPLREGADFFAGESGSLLCLDLLLNQRVGVEKATAAALAVHYHFGRPRFEAEAVISDATNWPYLGTALRTPAVLLRSLIERHLAGSRGPDVVLLSELPACVVGALASLERYYNRGNPFFEPLRKIEILPEIIQAITPACFRQVTGLNFPVENLSKQLASVATLLEMKRSGRVPARADLLALDRVGEETADTLLVYLFQQRALIADDYLRRVLYRHFVTEKEVASRRAIETAVGSRVQTADEAHRLHARVNEAGERYCFARDPNCEACPFREFTHR